MNYTILGGGLSAISLAYFLQKNKNIDEIHILEKDSVLGGICRTYKKNGIEYDEIFFGKPNADITIDDRVLRFQDNWNDITEIKLEQIAKEK